MDNHFQLTKTLNIMISMQNTINLRTLAIITVPAMNK